MTWGDSGFNDPIPRVERVGPFPLAVSHVALYRWLAARPPCATFNIGYALAIEGKVDVDALRRAVAQVVARHEPLRTRYVDLDGAPVQQIDAPPAEPLLVEDLRHLDASEAAAEGQRRFIADARRPFDLAKEPAVRWTLVRTGDRSNRLIVTLHSLGCGPMDVPTIIVPDLIAIYDALVAGEIPALPELRLQFVDYSAWLNKWLSGDGAPMVERSRRRFTDARPFDVPTDRPRFSPVPLDAETVDFELPKNVVAPLDALCRQHRIPAPAVFVAALAVSLARRAKQSDVVVSVLSDIRTAKPELATMVGRFIGPLLCRLDLGGELTGVQLLRRARGSLVELHKHRLVPLNVILSDPNPLDDPLLRIMANIITQTFSRWPSFRGTQTSWDMTQIDECKTEFVLSAFRWAPDRWAGYLRVAKAFYDRATVESMVSDFVQCTTTLVLTPEAKVDIG